MTRRHRVCLEIPLGGARLMEIGVEDFLKRKINGNLGTRKLRDNSNCYSISCSPFCCSPSHCRVHEIR